MRKDKIRKAQIYVNIAGKQRRRRKSIVTEAFFFSYGRKKEGIMSWNMDHHRESTRIMIIVCRLL